MQAVEQMDGMMIEPDFSEVKDSVEAGVYSARIVDSKVDKWTGKEDQNGSKKPDTTFINWTLETFNEQDEKNNGRKIFHKTPVNGGGAFRLKEFYKAAMGEDCVGAFDRTMLYGKELQVTVVDGKTKTGEPTGYTEVKTVRPITQ